MTRTLPWTIDLRLNMEENRNSKSACPICGKPVLQSDSPGPICRACLLAQAIGEGCGNAASELPTVAGDETIPFSVKERATASSPPPPQPESLSHPGSQIGPYRLVSELGEGGFGSVFLAEQEKPVKRRVALKLIKPGMDSREIVARFEAERQALALMDHPNIAHVHDAGTTDRGLPYFVMELVEGLPITKYCDAKKLNVRERLGVFLQVCAGVQHAHQKGIVHRDLKPANVLVSEVDGAAVAKVIDFGIAKALHSELTEKTFFTAEGQIIGTPQYMSPEQVSGDSADVDTRCDIFSLGIILYELLTGEPPIPYREFVKAGLVEVIRIICEKDAPRASVCIRRSGDRASTVAETRATGVRRLLKTIRGDLDCIMQKAVEKDRDHRYDSVSAFSGDVKRFLENETVTARPPTWGYRFRKYARRHKGQVAAAGAVLTTLFFGIVASSWFAWQSMKDAERARVAELKERFGREATSALQMAPAAPAKALTRLDSVVRGWEARFGSEEEFTTPVIAALSQIPDLCRETARFSIENSPVALAVCQDQESVVIGSSGGSDRHPLPALQWQSLTGEGKIVHRIADSAPLTSLVAIDKDHLAAGFEDGSIKLIFLETGRAVREISSQGRPIRALAFANETKTIFSLDASGRVRRFNTAGQEIGNSVSVESSFYDQIVVNAGGTLAVVADSLGKEPGLVRIQFQSGEGHVYRTETPGTRVSAILINPAGTRIVTGHIDGQIHFRDSSGQSNGLPIIAHRAPITALGWIGGHVASASREGAIRVWEKEGAPLSPELKGHKEVAALAGVANGRYLLSVGRGSSARAWDLNGLQIRSPIPIQSSAEELSFAGKNGRLLVGAMSDGTLTAWDWVKGSQTAEVNVSGGKLIDLSVSKDGALLSCVPQSEGKVHLFRSDNLSPVARIGVDGEKFLASAFHTDPGKVFAFARSGNLYVAAAGSKWRAERIGSFPKPDGPLDFCFLRWLEDRQSLLVAGAKMRPFLVTEKGKLIAKVNEKTPQYREAAIWTDPADGGDRFVFGYTSGEALDLVQFRNGKFSQRQPVSVFPTRTMVEDLDINPSSGIIGIATVYGRFAMINRDLELISPPFQAHRGKADSIAAHPTRQIIATGGHDSVFRFWAAGPEAWRGLLQNRLESELDVSPNAVLAPVKRTVTASAAGVHFEAAGLTIPAHPDWKPWPQALLNTGYEIFVRAVGDDFRRIRVSAVYDLKGDRESGGGQAIFFGNQLLIGEIPEFNRPEYYFPKVAEYLNRTFDSINRHLSPSLVVDRSTLMTNWIGEPGLFRTTGEFIYSSGKRAEVAAYAFPVDGATVGAIAVVQKDDPQATAFLEQVESQLLNAVVRPENRLNPERLAAIREETENQSVLLQVNYATKKEYNRLADSWNKLRQVKDDPDARAELVRISEELVSLIDDVLANTQESWPGRKEWEIRRNRQRIRYWISLGLSGKREGVREQIDRELNWMRRQWNRNQTADNCAHLIEMLKDAGTYQRDSEFPLDERIANRDEVIELCEKHVEQTRGDQRMADLIYHMLHRGQLFFLKEDGAEPAKTAALEALERWTNWDDPQSGMASRWNLPRDICWFLSDVARDEKNQPEALHWASQCLEYSRKHIRYDKSQGSRKRHSEVLWKVANRERDQNGQATKRVIELGRQSIAILRTLDKEGPLTDGTRRSLEGRIKTLQLWEATRK